MKILYISNGGFGDQSWSTSWPRIWSEKGHEVDVFLMRHTGNPYHANPFIRKMFVEDKLEAAKKIKSVIDGRLYDSILMPDNNCSGVQDAVGVIKDLKNVHLFKKQTVIRDDLEIPPWTKPEWYFTDKEYKYIEDLNLKDSILFHPLSSSVNEESRNIDFNLIIECSKKIENIVVLYGGGRKYLPIDDLKRMEAAGIRLLWEDYNCFNDGSGATLGKFLALTSQCRASVHAWSGSFTFSMGYNKPYVQLVPGNSIRQNSSAPYRDTNELYKQGMNRAKCYGALKPSAWCISDRPEIVLEAIERITEGKTVLYDKDWVNFESMGLK